MKKRTKYIIFGGIALAVLLIVFGLAKGGGKQAFETERVVKKDLAKSVPATGKVVSGTDLDLSFRVSGTVGRLLVKTGQKVKTGQVLAELSNREQRAGVLQAQGALAQAQANLQKILDGASSEEVRLAEVTLENAKKSLEDTKKQQKQLVENAYKALLNGSLEARASLSNLSGVTVTVSGTYTLKTPTTYTLRLYQTGGGVRYEAIGQDGVSGYVSAGTALPLNDSGLYVTFSSAPSSVNDQWTIEIPNTKGTSYVTNLNAYNSALQTENTAVSSAEGVVSSAESSLALKKASARPAEVSSGQAQVTSARGQVESALALLENTIIRAPANGTVTSVDVKIGELATAQTPVIGLQDTENLYVEANISEATVAGVLSGKKVEYTFDALGDSQKFMGTVAFVDPASTLVAGIVNYKITAGLDNLQAFTGGIIRPGMTANLKIITQEKSGVLALPKKAITDKDGKKIVQVITDERKRIFTEREITTGLEGDGGFVEILSGVSEGESVAVFAEKK